MLFIVYISWPHPWTVLGLWAFLSWAIVGLPQLSLGDAYPSIVLYACSGIEEHNFVLCNLWAFLLVCLRLRLISTNFIFSGLTEGINWTLSFYLRAIILSINTFCKSSCVFLERLFLKMVAVVLKYFGVSFANVLFECVHVVPRSCLFNIIGNCVCSHIVLSLYVFQFCFISFSFVLWREPSEDLSSNITFTFLFFCLY